MFSKNDIRRLYINGQMPQEEALSILTLYHDMTYNQALKFINRI